MSNRITEKDSLRIRILTATGRFTPQEIATHFEDKYTADQVRRHINSKAPSLKGKLKRETSRGGVKLRAILTKIYPTVSIKEEFHVGERLRLDFYIAAPYNLGFEYDGVQHSKYTPGLHKSEEEFDDAVARDKLKEELCAGRGINLIRISHDEELTVDLVKEKIDEVGFGSGEIKEGFQTGKEKYKEKQKQYNKQVAERKRKQYQKYKSSESYQKNKQKQKEYRKQQYKKQKEWRKANVR